MLRKAEPEPTPERTKPEPEPEKEPPMGEPGPEWAQARQTWGAAWDVHWIGMAVVFALLTIFAVVCLIRLYRRKRKQQVMAKFALTVTIVVSLFTSTRCLYLIFNPYESPFDCLFGPGGCPLFISRLLFSVGLPSLLSAYLLLLLALHEVMQMKKIGNFGRLQSWWFLVGFVAFNYVFAIAADLVVAYLVEARVFLALCQGYFIAFSACLVSAFLYAGIRIYQTDKKTKLQISKMTVRCKNETKQGRDTVGKVVRLALATAILGLIFLALQIYSLAFVYVETFSGRKAEPWTWLTYQYVYRLVELAFAACILYNISYLPKRQLSRRKTQQTITYSNLKANEVKDPCNTVSIEECHTSN